MRPDLLLSTDTAKRLYQTAADLPIIDYHCHLSPKEIYEDVPFCDLSALWLGSDHYKWRLMRSAGIGEDRITGGADPADRFTAYAEALEYAAGNPLYLWSAMELSAVFGIETPLRADTAKGIRESANAYLAKNRVSPRSLLAHFRVETLCTTDDPADSLEWHEKLAADQTASFRMLPSFRTDNLLLTRKPDYPTYLRRLSKAAGMEIDSLDTLKRAVENRLAFFVRMGCRVTDVGIPVFPDRVFPDTQAGAVFAKILRGEAYTDEEYRGLLGNLFVFLGKLYKKYGLLMQWHLGVVRNANSALANALGADCGADCAGDPVCLNDGIRLLDAIEADGGLPHTVLYTLNPTAAAGLASVAASFPNVKMGAAWWFCDHKRGIEDTLQTVAENGCLGAFFGMLTDSRSFLSYVRHDYFRRILCDCIGKWVEGGEYDGASADRLVQKICYENIRKELIGP